LLTSLLFSEKHINKDDMLCAMLLRNKPQMKGSRNC
jgi:hypothetical protein